MIAQKEETGWLLPITGCKNQNTTLEKIGLSLSAYSSALFSNLLYFYSGRVTSDNCVYVSITPTVPEQLIMMSNYNNYNPMYETIAACICDPLYSR